MIKKGNDLREKITAFLPHSAMYMADAPLQNEPVTKKGNHYSRKSKSSKSNPTNPNVKDNGVPDPKRQRFQ